jgi:hypothetical protein
VFLGNQPHELFFLIAGWSQAARLQYAARPERAFQKVFT